MTFPDKEVSYFLRGSGARSNDESDTDVLNQGSNLQTCKDFTIMFILGWNSLGKHRIPSRERLETDVVIILIEAEDRLS